MKRQIILEKNIEAIPKNRIIALSKISKDQAKKALDGGYKKGELGFPEVDSKKVSVKLNQLKASQTEIILDKALQLAFKMFLIQAPYKVGGDLGSIVSSDGFIMDGHHRWCASWLVDPNATITATRIEMKGIELVTTLNIITTALFDRVGNVGKGNIKEFTGKNLSVILDKYISEGISNEFFSLKSTEIKTALGKVPKANGDYELGRAILIKNADSLPKDIIKTAPSRVGMPVIKEEEIEQVTKILAQGSIDFALIKY